MTSTLSSRRRTKAPPPGETGQEALYLRSLSDRQVVVTVKLRDGEQVRGWIEYFDDSMVRLTREGAPNLFIYKSQIRSIAEASKRRETKADGAGKRVSNGAGPNGAGTNGASPNGAGPSGASADKAVSENAVSSGAVS